MMEQEEPKQKNKFEIKDKNIKFDINSLKLDQLVEIPASLFKIYNEQPVQPLKKGKSKDQKPKK